MSGATESLGRKISTAEDLEGVVRAMKALAVSSIGQYERSVEALKEYNRTVELGLSVCLRQQGPSPVVSGRTQAPQAMIGAVVFGSDQGLVGRFNEVITEFASTSLKALPGKTKKIWAVGERARALLSDGGLIQAAILELPTSVNVITSLVGRILVEIETAIEHGEVTTIYLFHNQPKAGSTYEPVGKMLLPLDLGWQSRIVAIPWPSQNLPEVVEGPSPTLPAFIRGYLFVSLFQACAESLASENASRLAAMQRAERNIDDMLVGLKRKFRRMRQESINEELFDVIAGYEALGAEGRPRV